MDYDLMIELVESGYGKFTIIVFEPRTNRLLYQSPLLNAGDCINGSQYLFDLARSHGYRVQVQVCDQLVDIARQVVASLN